MLLASKLSRRNLTVCRNIFGKNPEDPMIGLNAFLDRSHWASLLINLKNFIFFISEKLWHNTCFPSLGSLGWNLTDLPSRRISTRVYVETQWIILYVELVLGSTLETYLKKHLLCASTLLSQLMAVWYTKSGFLDISQLFGLILNFNFCDIVTGSWENQDFDCFTNEFASGLSASV